MADGDQLALTKTKGEGRGQKLISHDPPLKINQAGNAALFSQPELTENAEKGKGSWWQLALRKSNVKTLIRHR